MSGPLDQDARDAAATEFAANVVVVAGAGSGKTTLLVQRLLNLVLGRGVSLSSIVADEAPAGIELGLGDGGDAGRRIPLTALLRRGIDRSYPYAVRRPGAGNGHRHRSAAIPQEDTAVGQAPVL